MIRNCKQSIMGTVEFEGQFAPMKKPQDFLVYPKPDSGPNIEIQSDNRFGRIDLDTGVLLLSKPKEGANSAKLTSDIVMSKNETILLSTSELQMLRAAIKKTGGLEVGQCGVVSDNIGAFEL